MPEITYVPPKKRKTLKTFNWLSYPNWIKHQLATGQITRKEFNEKIAKYGRTK